MPFTESAREREIFSGSSSGSRPERIDIAFVARLEERGVELAMGRAGVGKKRSALEKCRGGTVGQQQHTRVFVRFDDGNGCGRRRATEIHLTIQQTHALTAQFSFVSKSNIKYQNYNFKI